MASALNGTPARYDEIADFYETFAPDVYGDPPISTLLTLVGDVSGLRLLDWTGAMPHADPVPLYLVVRCRKQ